MDTKLTKEELENIIYTEDKELLDTMVQADNKSQPSIDSDEEREADNNGIWYYNLETKENSEVVPILEWDDYYDSDNWSDYESFNRQVQLERVWNSIEGEEENDYNVESSIDSFNIDSSNNLEEEEYDWEQMLGSGYWDDNGGSPQWVPTNSNELQFNHDLSI